MRPYDWECYAVLLLLRLFFFFFFNDTATTEIYTLSLHDALPIYRVPHHAHRVRVRDHHGAPQEARFLEPGGTGHFAVDRKSTRLNSSHSQISYAVFCLKKKKRAEIVEPSGRSLSGAVMSYPPEPS